MRGREAPLQGVVLPEGRRVQEGSHTDTGMENIECRAGGCGIGSMKLWEMGKSNYCNDLNFVLSQQNNLSFSEFSFCRVV